MATRRKPGAGGIYEDLFDEEERGQLAAAALLTGVDAELAMMRVLVRKLMRSEDLQLDEVRRMLEGIGRMAKLKRDLEGAPGDAAGDALGRVLDTLATELGVSL